MLRILVIVMWFILTVNCNAQDLTTLFNQYVTVDNKGTYFTLLGVEYNGDYYWGKWELQDDLSYKLVDASLVDDSVYFNLLKASSIARNTQEIQKEEIENYDFNIEGCLSFSSFEESGFTYYLCNGKNFIKILGRVNATTNEKYSNFIYPLFLAPNCSYSNTVEVTRSSNDHISNYEMNFVISVFKTQDGWIENLNIIVPISSYSKNEVRKFGLDYSLIYRKILQGNLNDISQ